MKRMAFVIIFMSASLYADDRNTAEATFNQLKQLEGLWKVKESDSDFRIEFSLTANDSVLIETWISGGKKHSLTLYHMDNERLIATHYCPQGNQPRLELRRAVNSGWLEFDYFDATNMQSEMESHQHYLAFNIADDFKSMERAETYKQGSMESKDSLLLVRDR